MSLPRFSFIFIALLALAFAQSSAGTEGGNITEANVSANQSSIWAGVVGQTATGPMSQVAINVSPGDVISLVINVSTEGYPYGVAELHLLFSTSPDPITSLHRGNLSQLDAFINSTAESGSSTFIFSTTFITSFGTITGVPTIYTNAPDGSTFPVGYLQDQNGNFVFITPILSDQPGYNGSLFDFQLMLPTNGSNMTYYVSVDLVGNPTPEAGKPQQGGGGTQTPYYNVTHPPPPPPPPINVTPACEIVLYCDEWGPCVDGYRQQSCRDFTNCSDVEVFRVERCITPPANVTAQELPREIIRIMVSPEPFPCWLLLVILLLIIIYFVIYRRRNDQEEDAEERLRAKKQREKWQRKV